MRRGLPMSAIEEASRATWRSWTPSASSSIPSSSWRRRSATSCSPLCGSIGHSAAAGKPARSSGPRPPSDPRPARAPTEIAGPAGPPHETMRAACVASIMMALVLCPAWADAQATLEKPATTPPAAIPIAEIAGRADEVSALLRTLDERLPASPQIKRIEQELPALSERLADRSEQTHQTIESRHALGTLDALMDFWRSSRGALAAWMATVTERADWLEQQRVELAKLGVTWARTRTEVRAAKAPPEL